MKHIGIIEGKSFGKFEPMETIADETGKQVPVDAMANTVIQANPSFPAGGTGSEQKVWLLRYAYLTSLASLKASTAKKV